MRRTLHIPAGKAMPALEAVLQAQGIPRHVQPDARILAIAEQALALYREHAQPIGLLAEIGKDEFSEVFTGEGGNEPESPVGPIAQNADQLALFVLTLGEPVCAEIARLFRENEFALASMLDAVASEGAETGAQLLENEHREQLRARGGFDRKTGILRFSPGYCGWHLTAQRKLFEHLRPGDIGIMLNDSCLMQPIKSISGVVISGPKHIFEFSDTFAFCRDCATHTCRDRINALLNE